MSPLAEVIPGAVLLVMALGLIGAAGGLVLELVWDEWRAGQRWREVDRLARLEAIERKPPRAARLVRGVRRSRGWEPASWAGSAKGSWRPRRTRSPTRRQARALRPAARAAWRR